MIEYSTQYSKEAIVIFAIVVDEPIVRSFAHLSFFELVLVIIGTCILSSTGNVTVD